MNYLTVLSWILYSLIGRPIARTGLLIHNIGGWFISQSVDIDYRQLMAEQDRRKKILDELVSLGVSPPDCECDNTHEQNKTVCWPCWNAGYRYETAWWRTKKREQNEQ